jgi:sulfite reductase (NADPH) flavoprotein alpha-component
MTISIWRYSHLALAISSFLLLLLASITGIILAFKPLSEKVQPFGTPEFDNITLAQTLPGLRDKYPGISELTVDANKFVKIKGSDAQGKEINAYVNPLTGAILGTPSPDNEFFDWVTALHRSLLIHETGRFFIGITAFLLMLITVSGAFLVVQRQRGWKRFFTKINRDNFSQYYHVVLGRLSLIPIFIIALSGTYLSMSRFGLVDLTQPGIQVDFDAIRSGPVKSPSDFEIFKSTLLAQVQTIEFPFSEDVEDYFVLKLSDRELNVNQITGEILGESKYPVAQLLTNLSLDLHTGRTSVVWAIVLALATINILLFIYSGFAITFKRRGNRVKNKYTEKDAEFVILVGSENGSTFRFAHAIFDELLAHDKKAFVCELNQYTEFPMATHMVVMTATYGLGDAPTNASNFSKIIEKTSQDHPINYSVVGFGSQGYPDFCKFAFEIDNMLGKQGWAVPLLEMHTVNDKSPQEFSNWAATWSQLVGVPLELSNNLLANRPEPAVKIKVVCKTQVSHVGESFIIQFRPSEPVSFHSGDLLSIHPANDHRERLYSIGKVDEYIQLSVKLFADGLGSGYLYALQPGDDVEVRIVNNPHFHFPSHTGPVMMISNGTGIAPFLGMIDEQMEEARCHLYCGFRDTASYALYKPALEKNLQEKKLGGLHIAFSREGERQYVKDLLEKDAKLVAEVLKNHGVIMLCGSLAMQKNVVALLDDICRQYLDKNVSYYQSHRQILMDCY